MPDLRVLMLSWEYPPVVHGGLGHSIIVFVFFTIDTISNVNVIR